MVQELHRIPDIHNIREKTRYLKDKYYTDPEHQNQLNVHDIVTKVQEGMNTVRKHWNEQVEE